MFQGGMKAKDTGTELDSFILAVEDNENTVAEQQASETGLVTASLGLFDYARSNGGDVTGKEILVHCPAVSAVRLDMLLEGSDSANYYEDYLSPAVNAASTVASAAGKTISMPVVVFRQGESGTKIAANYKTELIQYRNQIDATANSAFPLHPQGFLKMVSYQTSVFGNSGLNDYPARAQFELHRDESWFCIGTPVYPIYAKGYPSNPQVYHSLLDDVHPTPRGYLWMGEYERRVIGKLTYGTKPNDRVYPVSATTVGQQVTVSFNAPNNDLVIDTSEIPLVPDYGIALEDDTGILVLSNISIVGGNSIQFNTDRAVGANAEFRIALDHSFAGSQLAGGGGVASNVRDSNAETVVIESISHPLYNWALSSYVQVPAT
jgi:hypothetical protein